MAIRSSAGRRERARAQAREDILLAAAEVFDRRGYAAATLAELAGAAGFAAPSLYRYFESKEEIFRSLVELVTTELGETFDAPVDLRRPLADRLATLLAAQRRVAERRRAVFAVLRAPDAPDVMGMRSRRAGICFYETRLAAWFGRNASAGELRVAPEPAARALAGILFAFTPETDDGSDDAAERHRTIISLALEGIAAPAPRRRGATP